MPINPAAKYNILLSFDKTTKVCLLIPLLKYLYNALFTNINSRFVLDSLDENKLNIGFSEDRYICFDGLNHI